MGQHMGTFHFKKFIYLFIYLFSFFFYVAMLASDVFIHNLKYGNIMDERFSNI
jgi:hypothetical protein